MSEAMILTNAVLKEIMTDAFVYRGKLVDWDSSTAPGIYSVTGVRCDSMPSNINPYGVVRVMVAGEYVVQEFLSHQYYGNHIGGYWKRMRSSSGWTAWEYYAKSAIPS